jgi:flagellar hook protein FlgE
MNKLQYTAHNATLTSTQMMDVVSGNIYGASVNGHRARRWSFSDYLSGGEFQVNGYATNQGKQEPRIGEWTKMMIRGRGWFTLRDPRNNGSLYTRLGDFHIDAAGNLVSKDGFHVQAYPLAGAATALRGPNPADPDAILPNPNLVDPFNNPYTNLNQELDNPGQLIGNLQDINLKLDPYTGRYLGQYEEIKVGEDGILYGMDGSNAVSLYKLSVVAFNNDEGLRDAKSGLYFQSTPKSGLPMLNAGDSIVISEALEESNVWMKTEAYYMTEAQRYFQASTQMHKLADKITGTAIEMIQ